MGSYVLQDGEGQKAGFQSYRQGVAKKIPAAATACRSTRRLHSDPPLNYLQALLNQCFLKQTIIREVRGGEPLGHVPLPFTAALPKH